MATWRGSGLVSGASGRVGGCVFARHGGRQTVRACCKGRGFSGERRAPGASGDGDILVSRGLLLSRAARAWAAKDASTRAWWSKEFGGEVGGRKAFIRWWCDIDAYYAQFDMVNPYAGMPVYVGGYVSGFFAGVYLTATGGAEYKAYWNNFGAVYPFVDVWITRGIRRGRVCGVRRWCGVQYVWDGGWYDWTAWLQGSPRNYEFQAGEMVRVEVGPHHHWYAGAGVRQMFEVEVT